jgi:hypothetical protein
MTYAERLTKLLIKYAEEGLSYEEAVEKILLKVDKDITPEASNDD